MKINVDIIYPIGSIYMSVNSTNPSTLFGGTWTQLKGRFLVGAGGSAEEQNNNTAKGSILDSQINQADWFTVGETGGEYDHQLSVDEMPSHNHKVALYASSWTSNYVTGSGFNAAAWGNWSSTGGSGYRASASDKTYTGGSDYHNTTPPYLAVYMWKRTA